MLAARMRHFGVGVMNIAGQCGGDALFEHTDVFASQDFHSQFVRNVGDRAITNDSRRYACGAVRELAIQGKHGHQNVKEAMIDLLN